MAPGEGCSTRVKTFSNGGRHEELLSVRRSAFSDTRNLRFGISITRGVAWSPGGIDQSTNAPGIAAIDRATYSTSASFGTLLYQIAAAWAPIADRSLRLGLSAGLSQSTYSNNSTFSGQISVGGQPGQFLSTLRATGNELDFVFGVGAQWDVVGGLTIGALVRSPCGPVRTRPQGSQFTGVKGPSSRHIAGYCWLSDL